VLLTAFFINFKGISFRFCLKSIIIFVFISKNSYETSTTFLIYKEMSKWKYYQNKKEKEK
jgi:hypothetical protein